jgi:ribosome-associated toxin RatA of RatAB toxin-antitoxin module
MLSVKEFYGSCLPFAKLIAVWWKEKRMTASAVLCYFMNAKQNKQTNASLHQANIHNMFKSFPVGWPFLPRSSIAANNCLCQIMFKFLFSPVQAVPSVALTTQIQFWLSNINVTVNSKILLTKLFLLPNYSIPLEPNML